MSSTTIKQSELLNAQLGSDGTPKESSNSELIQREKIEGTPFWIIGQEEKEWFITMKNYKITEAKGTKEEAIEELEKNKWSVIAAVCEIVTIEIANSAGAMLKAAEEEEKNKIG